MTKQNDDNDVIALDRGYAVIDHPKGRGHDHSSYMKGTTHVWRAHTTDQNGPRTFWVKADLLEGHYKNHAEFVDLEDAL